MGSWPVGSEVVARWYGVVEVENEVRAQGECMPASVCGGECVRERVRACVWCVCVCVEEAWLSGLSLRTSPNGCNGTWTLGRGRGVAGIDARTQEMYGDLQWVSAEVHRSGPAGLDVAAAERGSCVN